MKYSFETKKDTIKNKMKIACELCSLAFVICALTLMFYLAKSPFEITVIDDDEEIVSVFKESELYYFFDFDEATKTEEGVYDFNDKSVAQCNNE